MPSALSAPLAVNFLLSELRSFSGGRSAASGQCPLRSLRPLRLTLLLPERGPPRRISVAESGGFLDWERTRRASGSERRIAASPRIRDSATQGRSWPPGNSVPRRRHPKTRRTPDNPSLPRRSPVGEYASRGHTRTRWTIPSTTPSRPAIRPPGRASRPRRLIPAPARAPCNPPVAGIFFVC